MGSSKDLRAIRIPPFYEVRGRAYVV